MTSHRKSPPDVPIVLEPYAFSSLLVSAIEVYRRESLGFLIGHADRQFVGGRRTDCLSIRTSYPIQSADRGTRSVGYGNLAARMRAINTVRAVGFELVGGFHSHTELQPWLSDEDVEVIRAEFEDDFAKMGLTRWLEIVVSVRRIKKAKAVESLRRRLLRHNRSELGFHPCHTKPFIMGDVMVGRGLAYKVSMAGYVFDEKEARVVLLCYSRY